MKKLMMLILTLLLCASAFAEGAAAIPVKIADPANGHIALETAITTALQVLPVQPESYQTHAELVRMSDDGARWIVTVFDLTTLSDGWCVEIDAFTGEVLMSYTTYDGFSRMFTTVGSRRMVSTPYGPWRTSSFMTCFIP
jgi:hypothetical protein